MAKIQAQSVVPAQAVAAAAMPFPGGQQPDVRLSSNTNRRGLKRNEKPPGCWAQGGTLNCFRSTDRLLADIAKNRGVAIEELSGQVDRIQAARVGQEPRIYIYPVAKENPDGVEVTRSTQNLSINLFDFLAAENLLIPVGRRQRFDLTYVSKAEAPAAIGESIQLDFSKRLEEKVLPKRKSKSKSKQKNNTNMPPQPDMQTGVSEL